MKRRRNGKTATLDTKHDKFQLYQESVQNPSFEVKFMRQVYRRTRGTEPLRLREDFCGSAVLSCEWTRQVRTGTAIGLDLDRPTLDYAMHTNVAALGEDAGRVRLLRQNVLDASGRDRPDIVAAYNFSWFIFKKREELLKYFRRVHRTLASDGIFMLDIYGGPDAQIIQEETTAHDGFDYVWDQARYNPLTGETLCHIHFDFPDGTRMKNAFTYDWRLWSIPETADILAEAGFEGLEVYWEGTDRKSGEGNGVFRPSTKGDDSSCWIAYLRANK